MSTNPNDYSLPILDLPDFWKYGIDTLGRLYYYHVKIRIPQWEPPIKLLPLMEEQHAFAIKNIDGCKKIKAGDDEINKSGNKTESDSAESDENKTSSTDTDDSSEEELQKKLIQIKSIVKANKSDLGKLFNFIVFIYYPSSTTSSSPLLQSKF